MASVPFHIYWKTKAEHFRSTLTSLLQQEKLCDVTILCEGEVFKAHQLVLSICSDYFETVLQDVPVAQHPIIFLRDVAADEFRYMLDYMYTGEVILPEGILTRFLETCKLLRIKGLHSEDESEEAESNKENSPSQTPKKNNKNSAQVHNLPTRASLVNTENSEDITVADLEDQQRVDDADDSNILESPPRSPDSLVFSLNKLPETLVTSDSLIVQDDDESSNEVIILSEDTQEQGQKEPTEESPSDTYFTSHSVDQNTFMEGIELLETSQARNIEDSDESEVIAPRRRNMRIFRKEAEKKKNETDFHLATKKQAIRNAQNLRVILPKIPKDESSDRTTDKSEASPSKRKKPNSSPKGASDDGAKVHKNIIVFDDSD